MDPEESKTRAASSVLDLESSHEDSVIAHELNRVVSSDTSLAKLKEISKTLSLSNNAKLSIDPEHFDLKETLTKFVQRSEDAGLNQSKVSITMRNVSTLGIHEGFKYSPSMYEVARSIVTLPNTIRSMTNPPLRKIIQDFDAIVKPGEMILVLGRPGAGCSTLLRTIAGEIDELKGVEGEMLYGGATQAEMLRNFKSEILYNPELDVHFPHLNVEQTLRFAAASRTPRVRLDNMTRQEYEDLQLELLATVFGLKHTFKTKVGNDFVKGISGGEKKRVSITEALAARASVYCWDNATRGLDASTALEYAQAIRVSTHLLQSSSIVAIYQASENIYELFDRVTVLYKGQQIYFGPVAEARKYFEDMGYACPPRQTTAEFLNAVTDPNGRFKREGALNVPETPQEFVDYWHNSPQYEKLIAEIEEEKQSINGDETVETFLENGQMAKMKHQRKRSKYMLSYAAQLRLGIRRGYQRVWGDKAYTLTQTIGTIMQSLLMASLFYKIPQSTAGAFSRGGVVFFALLFNTMLVLADITLQFDVRPILLKQRAYSFYHPSVEALQLLLTDAPIKVFVMTIFCIVIYFMTDLRRDAGAFFMFYLMMLVSAFANGAIFQTIASVSATSAPANSMAGIWLMVVLVYAGYMIPRPSMHPWFKWLWYCNPLSYSFEAMMASEFHGREMPCSDLIPSGPGYENVSLSNQVCAQVGSQPGQDVVSGDAYVKDQFDYQYDHYWRNFGIVIAFWIGFTFLNAWATERVRGEGGGGDVLLFKRGKVPEKIEEGRVAGAEALNRSLTTIGSSEIFTWQHVDYTIPADGGYRKLLDDIQGYVKPGTLTALMGESGAGKTTLLNVLSKRVKVGTITGDMLVDGKPIGSSFQRRVGYVTQQDVHLAEYSVRESLQFAARLRQPAHVPDAEKLEYVEKIIGLLGMTDYAEAMVGIPGRGLNVEQRKKLSIGVELVAKPTLLLFLDEPTSGLDSQSAWAIVLFLRQLAAAGQAILCTIHQPSATLFQQFDRLLLLQKGGQTVYFGDIGTNSRTLIDYFEQQGARQCGDQENPAEYILECIGAGAAASVETNWSDIWKASTEYAEVTAEVDELTRELAVLPAANVDKSLNRRFAASYAMQFWHVYRRTQIQFWRSPTYIISKMIMIIAAGLFVGFTFWNVGHSLTDLYNIMFAMFLSLILSVPLTQQIQMFAFSSRELYEVRESSSTFHWPVLLLSQFLAEIPYAVVFMTIMFVPYYFGVGFDTAAHVAGYYFLVYIIFFQLYSISYALWIVYFSADGPTAAVTTSLLFAFTISFSGVWQPKSLAPHFWSSFMYQVTPYTYFVQSLLGNFLHDREVVCSEKELALFVPPAGQTCSEFAGPFVKAQGGYLANPNASDICAYCKFSVGDDYLATLNIDYDSQRWRNVGLFVVYIVFNLAAMLVFYYLIRVKIWRNSRFFRSSKKVGK